MVKKIRRWHSALLHEVWGLPDRDHAGPHATVSEVLRSHPKVAAHGRHLTPMHLSARHSPNFAEQRARELRREPRVLKGWQHRISALFTRDGEGQSGEDHGA